MHGLMWLTLLSKNTLRKSAKLQVCLSFPFSTQKPLLLRSMHVYMYVGMIAISTTTLALPFKQDQLNPQRHVLLQ